MTQDLQVYLDLLEAQDHKDQLVSVDHLVRQGLEDFRVCPEFLDLQDSMVKTESKEFQDKQVHRVRQEAEEKEDILANADLPENLDHKASKEKQDRREVMD